MKLSVLLQNLSTLQAQILDLKDMIRRCNVTNDDVEHAVQKYATSAQIRETHLIDSLRSQLKTIVSQLDGIKAMHDDMHCALHKSARIHKRLLCYQVREFVNQCDASCTWANVCSTFTLVSNDCSRFFDVNMTLGEIVDQARFHIKNGNDHMIDVQMWMQQHIIKEPLITDDSMIASIFIAQCCSVFDECVDVVVSGSPKSSVRDKESHQTISHSEPHSQPNPSEIDTTSVGETKGVSTESLPTDIIPPTGTPSDKLDDAISGIARLPEVELEIVDVSEQVSESELPDGRDGIIKSEPLAEQVPLSCRIDSTTGFEEKESESNGGGDGVSDIHKEEVSGLKIGDIEEGGGTISVVKPGDSTINPSDDTKNDVDVASDIVSANTKATRRSSRRRK